MIAANETPIRTWNRSAFVALLLTSAPRLRNFNVIEPLSEVSRGSPYVKKKISNSHMQQGRDLKMRQLRSFLFWCNACVSLRYLNTEVIVVSFSFYVEKLLSKFTSGVIRWTFKKWALARDTYGLARQLIRKPQLFHTEYFLRSIVIGEINLRNVSHFYSNKKKKSIVPQRFLSDNEMQNPRKASLILYGGNSRTWRQLIAPLANFPSVFSFSFVCGRRLTS